MIPQLIELNRQGNASSRRRDPDDESSQLCLVQIAASRGLTCLLRCIRPIPLRASDHVLQRPWRAEPRYVFAKAPSSIKFLTNLRTCLRISRVINDGGAYPGVLCAFCSAAVQESHSGKAIKPVIIIADA